MENKEFKGMVSALEKVAGEQKRVTGHLLEKLETVTEALIKILEEHHLEDNLKRFDFKAYGFRDVGSQHGSSSMLVSLCENEGYYQRNVLPTRTEDIGSWTYWHGDYNSKVNYMSRTEVLTVCELLSEFIQNMVSKIQSLTDKEQKFLNQFENISI